MYSFARKRWSLPLAGGFVVEYPNHYLNSKGDTPLKVLRVALSDDMYTRLDAIIADFIKRKDDLIYNSIDAVTSSLFHRSVPIRDSFTCVSFCCHLFGLRKIRTIPEFEKKIAGTLVFEGSYRDYITYEKQSDVTYYESMSYISIISKTIYHFARLLTRLVKESF